MLHFTEELPCSVFPCKNGESVSYGCMLSAVSCSLCYDGWSLCVLIDHLSAWLLRLRAWHHSFNVCRKFRSVWGSHYIVLGRMSLLLRENINYRRGTTKVMGDHKILGTFSKYSILKFQYFFFKLFFDVENN